MSIILSILKEYETDPPGKCCHGRDRNNICQEDFSMEILETEKRKMNKNKEKKKELTHFLEHYWIYAIILVIILFYFTSSNLSYTDNQWLTFVWYKNVSSI